MQRLIVCPCVCVCVFVRVFAKSFCFFCPCLFTMRQAGNQLCFLATCGCCLAGQRFASFHFPGAQPLMCKGFYRNRQKDSLSLSTLYLLSRVQQKKRAVHRFQFNISLLQLPPLLSAASPLLTTAFPPLAAAPPFLFLCLFCARIFRVYLLHMFLLNSLCGAACADRCDINIYAVEYCQHQR